MLIFHGQLIKNQWMDWTRPCEPVGGATVPNSPRPRLSKADGLGGDGIAPLPLPSGND